MTIIDSAVRGGVKPLATTLMIAATALLGAAPASAQSPWGIRNTAWPGFGLQTWPTCPSGNGCAPSTHCAFSPLSPGHVNEWILWSQFSTPTGYDWTAIDADMDKTLSVGGAPVIGYKLTGPNMQTSPFTAPIGLEPGQTPQWPPPFPKGYHEGLYDDSLELARRIRDFYRPTSPPYPSTCAQLPASPARVYIVFHPEPWCEWPLGTVPGSVQWSKSLNAYILSFLTVRKAFDDAQKEDELNPIVDFKFSHGSIPRGRVLPRDWLAEGADVTKRPRLLDQYNSYFERVPKRVHSRLNKFSFQTWADVQNYSSAQQGSLHWVRNRLDDEWLAAMVDWTAQGFFDFNTQHAHGKPWYDDLERVLVDDEIRLANAEPPPWILTEHDFERVELKGTVPCGEGCTMWVPISQEWPYAYVPTFTPDARAVWLANNLERFVMEDYLRKWCAGLAHETWALDWDLTVLPGPVVRPGDAVTALCSSAISGNNLCLGPHRDYFSLFERCWPAGSLPQIFGAQACGPAAIAPPGEQAIQPTFVEAAFRFLANEVGMPDDVITVHDDETYAHYRFNLVASAGKYVDAVYMRSLFDADEPTMPLTVTTPDPTYNKFVRKYMDPVSGTLTCIPASGTTSGTQIPLSISPAPQFVVWTQ